MTRALATLCLLTSLALTSASFDCKSGALSASEPDIYRQNMSLSSAKAWCDEQVSCGGFTAKASECIGSTPNTTYDVHFKSSLIDSNGDPRWRTWSKQNWSGSPFYYCNQLINK